MLRTAALALPLLALAACATPREACLSQATSGIRTAERQAAAIRRDLDRGFAVREFEERTRVRRDCVRVNDAGESVNAVCDEVQTTTREEPVPINAAALRARLRELDASLAQARATLPARQRACIAAHPE
ncbi:MAG: hypothetical protein ACU0BF_00960 [Paracoccaceae bacterium]